VSIKRGINNGFRATSVLGGLCGLFTGKSHLINLFKVVASSFNSLKLERPEFVSLF